MESMYQLCCISYLQYHTHPLINVRQVYILNLTPKRISRNLMFSCLIRRLVLVHAKLRERRPVRFRLCSPYAADELRQTYDGI